MTGRDRRALIVEIACDPARAIARQFKAPLDHRGVRSPSRDQPVNAVASRTTALRAFDPKKIELPGDVSEDECAVAGHGRVKTISSQAV